jgi:hypothetical protein
MEAGTEPYASTWRGVWRYARQDKARMARLMFIMMTLGAILATFVAGILIVIGVIR